MDNECRSANLAIFEPKRLGSKKFFSYSVGIYLRYEQSAPLFLFGISDEMINEMICVERRTQKKIEF